MLFRVVTHGDRRPICGTLAGFAWFVWVWSACGGSLPATHPTSKSGEARRVVRYEFGLDEGLEQMVTTVCFEGPAPGALTAIHEAGRTRLVAAEAVGPHGTRPLSHAGAIDLRGLGPRECVRYVVDLAPSTGGIPGAPGSYRVGNDLVAPTHLWLWAPDPRASDMRIRGRFVLPDGMQVSMLWPTARDGWSEPDERAFRYVAYAAFGALERTRVPIPGGCLDVTMLDRALQVGVDDRRRWLETAGRAVSRVFGRFPQERTSVLIVPTPFGHTPVLFGIVGRGQLPTIALFVSEQATLEALEPDWTAIHEFAHLMSPYVEEEDAWLTEGLATYYQNVLRAREGLLTPREAWTELLRGFARGRAGGTGLPLEEEARVVARTFAWTRVYWAGAAIALLSDVGYRRESEGRDSLDRAMMRAANLRNQTLRASELVRAMDGEPDGVMRRVSGEWLGTSEFPSVGEVLEWLGVISSEEGAILVDAPGAALRDAMMNHEAPIASNPSGCD